MTRWLAYLQGRVLHAQGGLGYFGLAKESTWGIALGPTDYAEILRENVSASFDRFAFKNIIFGLNEPDDSAGVLRIQGDVIMAAHPVAMGHLLQAAMPTASVSVVLSGFLYTTRFVTTKSEFAQGVASQPYTLELHRDVGSAFQVAGAVCHQLALALTPNQDLRMTAGFIGKSVLLKSTGAPAFPSSPTYPFMFDTANVQIRCADPAPLPSA